MFDGAHPYRDREWLAVQYQDYQRSMQDIADEFGITGTAVWHWMKKFGLVRRSSDCASRLPASRAKNSRKNSGPLASKWNGGDKITKDGYIKRWMPNHPHADANGCVPVHRLVVEKYLGRILSPEEIIHHKNGDKLDNRPENLEIRENIEHLHEHHRKWRERLAALPDAPKEEK